MKEEQQKPEKNILLKSFELEHEELLSQLKIILTALLAMIYGSVIAIMSDNIKMENPYESTIYLLFYGFLGVGFVMWIYHRKLRDIRKGVKLLSE